MDPRSITADEPQPPQRARATAQRGEEEEDQRTEIPKVYQAAAQASHPCSASPRDFRPQVLVDLSGMRELGVAKGAGHDRLRTTKRRMFIGW